MALTLLEHSSSGYVGRTFANATSADLTLAFACDFTTAGEKLTARSAASRLVRLRLQEDADPAESAACVLRAKGVRPLQSVNIAGNGLYTLVQYGWTQARINQWVYDVLKLVHHTADLRPWSSDHRSVSTRISTARRRGDRHQPARGRPPHRNHWLGERPSSMTAVLHACRSKVTWSSRRCTSRSRCRRSPRPSTSSSTPSPASLPRASSRSNARWQATASVGSPERPRAVAAASWSRSRPAVRCSATSWRPRDSLSFA